MAGRGGGVVKAEQLREELRNAGEDRAAAQDALRRATGRLTSLLCEADAESPITVTEAARLTGLTRNGVYHLLGRGSGRPAKD